MLKYNSERYRKWAFLSSANLVFCNKLHNKHMFFVLKQVSACLCWAWWRNIIVCSFIWSVLTITTYNKNVLTSILFFFSIVRSNLLVDVFPKYEGYFNFGWLLNTKGLSWTIFEDLNILTGFKVSTIFFYGNCLFVLSLSIKRTEHIFSW